MTSFPRQTMKKMKKMKKINKLLLMVTLVGFFSAQAQASFSVTTNLSTIEVSGSVDDFVSNESNGYQDGVVYSSTTLPLHVSDDLLEGEASISTASAFSNAELNLDIAQTANGYDIWGRASSYAETAINSLDDNDATAMGNAAVDLAFTLTTSYSYLFDSELFDALGTGVSEVELINNSTKATVFSQVVSDDALELDFSGTLAAGDYTLFIGALSEAISGDFASADLEYNLQLTSVPLPAGLPLLLSGLAALGFKRRFDQKG
jgi:hypothetical protein